MPESDNTTRKRCPGCGGTAAPPFYTLEGVPVHDALLMNTVREARACPRGAIRLALCGACGLIANLNHEVVPIPVPALYEGSQSASPRFTRFHEELAGDLVARLDLRGKTVLEIGCGQGEFLKLLCRLGNNRGFGFDPAHRPGPERSRPDAAVTIYDREYGAHQTDPAADLICCKMTLEHIHAAGAFVETLRRNIGARRHCAVFIQVPDALQILRSAAFWDIYYEHCNYFSPAALANLFERKGFTVTERWTAHQGQYQFLIARPADRGRPIPPPRCDAAGAVSRFRESVGDRIARWRERLCRLFSQGRCVVLWGGGSKAVGFVSAVALAQEIAAVVDIHPRRRGSFLPGSGHPIVAPEALITLKPHTVVVMNPVYREEIAARLELLGLSPEIRSVEDP